MRGILLRDRPCTGEAGHSVCHRMLGFRAAVLPKVCQELRIVSSSQGRCYRDNPGPETVRSARLSQTVLPEG